ncbi:Serine/threonine-protein kinase MARK2, partial [Fasciola gigantica]
VINIICGHSLYCRLYNQGNATCRAYNDDNIKTNDLAPSTRNNRISPIKGSANSTTSNYNSYTGTDLNGTINGSGKTGHQYVNGNGSVHPVSKKPEIRLSSVPTSPVAEKRVVPEVPNTSRVGKYTILRTVGRGNFAQVKLAVHLTTGCEVAIKMIDKTSLSENCLIKLAREVRVLKSLSHPNVVRLYEVIETTRHVYMVMEYAKNGEVFEHLLKAGRMAETKVRVIFRQLFSAVEYCHKKNIVHRDLKELHSRVLSGKYRIPFYMSGDCEAILKKMLVLNPTKRATLRELMKEKWINIGYENDPLQPYVEPQMDYNDPIRRAIMNELGFSPEDLRDAFENYRFNNVTATYLLLADTETRHRITRKLQNGSHVGARNLFFKE